MKSVSNIEINLDSVKNGLSIWIDARRPNTLFDAEKDAEQYNEARFQLVEGCLYDYQISDIEYELGDVGENIVLKHKRVTNLGTISPNIFVGTLSIPIIQKITNQEVSKIYLEVQSIKSSYRDDYRDMLELITEKCTELLLQANSPVTQHFEIDYTRDSQSLYQKFSFIKSIIGTDDFSEAIHRIVTAPVTKWTETLEEKDIRNTRRLSNTNIKEVLKGGKRTKIPEKHYLKYYGINTLPERIITIRKNDSVDTPENRFIKHALENFLKFCTDINNKAKDYGHKKMENESDLMIRELERHLHHSFFKDILRPTTLILNSPVLQRKEGYRQVLRVWLMFDLAAKLIWKGGDDTYSGGKKDIATLYEYWLFFKLLDLFQSIFELESKDISELIKETPDGLNLQIKQGNFTALHGVYDSGNRKLNISFNYNRIFSGKKTYPDSGSWTTTLRPDFTLSFWPYGISDTEAEKQELIVHIHFDAKYKVANLIDFMEQNKEIDIDKQKVENRKGIYNNGDLLKMHAYKDAIRRTGGAYILYPGDKSINKRGFHEIIPGLGAFPVKPSKTDSGIVELKSFILEIIEHFVNRATQREKIAYRTFDIYKNPPDSGMVVNEPLPEPYNNNRDLIPSDTYVLIGYYKDETHLGWIKESGHYNVRYGEKYELSQYEIGAQYLLLYSKGQTESSLFFKFKKNGPKIYLKSELKNELKYRSTPSHEMYLVYQLEDECDKEFKELNIDLKNIVVSGDNRKPIAFSLEKLVKEKVK
jgi:predicted component of viral defense system (DUF524 family)